jgi:hypothetical protein
MVQAYDSERRFIRSQGSVLGTPAVELQEDESAEGSE